MYGLIAKMIAAPGQRDALIDLIVAGSAEMPGCVNYIVAKDAENSDVIWVTEVWDSEDSHKASLAIPAVKETIGKAMSLIAGFEKGATTIPVGGIGL